MELLYKKNRHSCYVLEYYLVACTGHRYKVLEGPLETRLKEITCRLIEENFGGQLIRTECDKDHIHVLLSLPPQISIAQFVNSWKTVTSRLLRKEFREQLKPYYADCSFWSKSYFAASVSNRTDEAVRQYIASQKGEAHQRKRQARDNDRRFARARRKNK